MQNALGERRFESQFSFLIFKKHCKYHDLLLTVIRRRLKKEKNTRAENHPAGCLSIDDDEVMMVLFNVIVVSTKNGSDFGGETCDSPGRGVKDATS